MDLINVSIFDYRQTQRGQRILFCVVFTPSPQPPLKCLTPKYVILEDFNFTRGRLYPRYNLPHLDLYLGYLLNLLNVISWTILAKHPPPPRPIARIRRFLVVKMTF